MSESFPKRLLLLAASAGYYAVTKILGWFLPSWSKSDVILYYHGVSIQQRQSFRKQIEWLHRRRRIVRLPDLMEGEWGNRCSITFDDAISNILTSAIPVLREMQLPATVFAVSGNLGQKPQWDIPEVDPDAHADVMTAVQLADLPRQGIDVGSHTVSHRALAALSLEEVCTELRESRRQLEESVKQPVRCLSVPYGAVHPDLSTAALHCGYHMVLTSAPRTVECTSNPLHLGRFGVSPDDWTIEFRLKALGAYSWRRFLKRHRCKKNMAKQGSWETPQLMTLQPKAVQRGC